MKYTKIILLLLLLLTAGCNTTEEVQQSTITIEEAEEALALLYHDTIALSISSFYISEEDVAPLFPASLADYSDTLYRYSRLQKDASTSLKDLLNAAAMHALDALDGFSYVAAHPKESLIDSLFMLLNISYIFICRLFFSLAYFAGISHYTFLLYCLYPFLNPSIGISALIIVCF